jgi:hypothetical protein
VWGMGKMTRRRDLMLEDLIGCDHKLELPITEDGEILYWRCRCGEVQKTPEEMEKENDI